ncbi:MAG: Ig-like domain-containing protein, partial [Candidatus Latescibacterota bacterium]|nr:Ig-like domain-containing protein [Candidatus Latescibacterota bacterium]
MLRKYACSLFIALFLVSSASGQNLVDSTQDLPGVWAGDASWGDYDNDGDLDLALMGEVFEGGQAQRVVRLFGNEEALLFEDVGTSQQLVGVYHGALAWGDYDGDGDLDLAVAGWDISDSESLNLYKNDLVSRTLQQDRLQVDASGESSLEGVRYAALAWGDADNDGDIDLVVSGMDGNGLSQTAFYRNAEGVLLRDETNSETLVNLHNGSLAWGDYDGDGDLDLAVSGENVTSSGGLNAVSEFYKNDPPGTLELDGTMDAVNVKGGSLAWGDYDGDGNLDLAASGRPFGLFDGTDWVANITLYRNRPAGLLSVDNTFSLGATFRVAGDLSWVDYDNDGDSDLAAVGRSILSDYQAFVFANQSGRLSGVSAESNLVGLAGGSVEWVDYDGDGRADLLMTGSDDVGQRRTVLYNNQGPVAPNASPTPPQALNAPTVTSSRVLFSWSAGGDTEGDQITYNLRVGTQSGTGDVFSGTLPNGPGNAGFKTSKTLLRGLAPDTYYWSVQSVDAAFARSAWSQEQILNVGQFVSSDQSIRALQQSSMAWGDVDDDGDLDLAISGQNRSGDAQTLYYVNDRGALELDAEASLPAIRSGDVAWADYDSDGDLDLALTGEDTFDNRRASLYAFEQGAFSLIGSFPSVSESSLDWGDYDNDGDVDIAIIGQSDDVLNGRQQSYSRVFANDGEGGFATVEFELTGLNNGEVIWGDYDGDGDLDLTLSGQSADSSELLLYVNDEAQLSDADLGLIGLASSDIAWGDYDGDGDLDLAAGGISSSGLRTDVYVNDGNGDFILLNASFTGIQGGDIVWGDYDNDRDIDLVVVGNDGNGAILQMYENTLGRAGADSPFEVETVSMQGLDFSSVALVDIDADGDLDLVSSGSTGGFDPLPLSVVNDNLEAQFNSNLPPESPRLVAAQDDGSSVLLQWEAGSDDGEDTPQSLSYNLRIGRTSTGHDVLSGVIGLGLGNAGSNLSYRVNDLESGTYFWSAQTIDDGFARSEWSDAGTFVIDTVAPEMQDVNLSRSQLGIGQTATLALNIFDEHIGVDATVEPAVEAVGENGRYPLSRLQFTGSAWSGELTVDEEVPSGAYSIQVSGIADAKGNVMPTFIAENALTVDTDRPTVVDSSPVANAEGVVISTDEVVILFSEPLDPATVSADNIQLKLGDQLLENIPAPQYDASDNSVRIAPIGGILQPGSQYVVEISASVQDLVGNRPSNAISRLFSTRVPAVSSVDPAVDASDVIPGGTAITAVYDAPIAAAEISGIEVLREGIVESLRNAPVYDENALSLRVEPEAGLRPGSRYEVVLPGELSGPIGSQTQGDFRWSFQTRTPAVAVTAPVDGSEVEAGAGLMSVEFDTDIDVAALDGAVSVLENGLAVEVVDEDFNPETGILRFSVADGLSAGSAYQVRIGAGVGGPLRQSDYVFEFSTAVPVLESSLPVDQSASVGVDFEEMTLQFSAPVDADQLNESSFSLSAFGEAVALRSGDPVSRGDNAYGIAPAGGWRVGTRYELQVAPSVSGPLGTGQVQTLSFSTIVPALTATTPVIGDTSVANMGETIRAQFDGSIDEEALRSPGAVTLLQGGISVPITTPAFDRTTGALTFNASEGLQPGNAYAVRIASDVGGALQQDGAAYNWDFSTRIPSPVETTPTDNSTVASGLQRIQVVFSGPLNPDLINNQNFRLRRGGALIPLASDEFTYDPASFTVSFPSYEFRSGTEYSASAQALVSGPLAAIVGLEDLNWSFSTEVPRVVSTSPVDGDEGIGLASSNVQIAFSAAVARQLAGDFRISSRALGESGAASEIATITGFGADSSGTVLSFSIEGGLKPFTEYAVEMAPEVLGELSAEGYAWSFRTAASLADARQGGSVKNADGTLELYFPPNALPVGSNEVAIRRVVSDVSAFASETTQITDAYSVNTQADALSKRATLTMYYSAAQAEGYDSTRLAIFRMDSNGQWQRVGGSVDAQAKLVRTAVDELGTFALFEDRSTAVGDLAIRDLDCQPRAFAPGGSSLRGETDISFDLSGPADVTVRVYNSAGKLARVIVRDEPMAPGRISLKWNGQDQDQRAVS